jgi:hypothetical protein
LNLQLFLIFIPTFSEDDGELPFTHTLLGRIRIIFGCSASHTISSGSRKTDLGIEAMIQTLHNDFSSI